MKEGVDCVLCRIAPEGMISVADVMKKLNVSRNFLYTAVIPHVKREKSGGLTYLSLSDLRDTQLIL